MCGKLSHFTFCGKFFYEHKTIMKTMVWQLNNPFTAFHWRSSGRGSLNQMIFPIADIFERGVQSQDDPVFSACGTVDLSGLTIRKHKSSPNGQLLKLVQSKTSGDSSPLIIFLQTVAGSTFNGFCDQPGSKWSLFFLFEKMSEKKMSLLFRFCNLL